ncbi:hypothetical protein RHGRI_023631 [Rhododendron griersonianum]|uniref:Uncharacterized protein n=1 Tax=Rhododendron griersonianum TaxID=479676 RepID=A0AAV6J4C6_9ERIC|nr:hypothetical protein RHGRI_023631 [Rhododendron griersonianum]
MPLSPSSPRSPPSPSLPRSLQPFFGFPSSQFGASVALVRRDSPLRWLCPATGGDPQPVVQHGGSRSVMLEAGGVVIRSGGLGGGLRNKVVRVCWVVGVKAAGVVGCVGGASWGFPATVAVAPSNGELVILIFRRSRSRALSRVCSDSDVDFLRDSISYGENGAVEHHRNQVYRPSQGSSSS